MHLMTFQAAESEQSCSFYNAMEAGIPTHTKLRPSLADGLTVTKVGGTAFGIARGYPNLKCCVVEEDWIALAILRLVEIEKCVVEGAGATGLAACLSGKLNDDLKGKK